MVDLEPDPLEILPRPTGRYPIEGAASGSTLQWLPDSKLGSLQRTSKHAVLAFRRCQILPSFSSVQCPTSALRRLILLVHAGVFNCSYNPLNSEMDYKVFRIVSNFTIMTPFSAARFFWCSPNPLNSDMHHMVFFRVVSNFIHFVVFLNH